MVLADTGALLALLDRDDIWHGRVRDWWAAADEHIRVPHTVLPEITYLLATRRGPRAEELFVRAVAAGEFPLEAFDEGDLGRIADLIAAYADLPLGFVDASVVAMAERLGVTSILTTDRRHFSVVRPAHVERLRLVP